MHFWTPFNIYTFGGCWEKQVWSLFHNSPLSCFNLSGRFCRIWPSSVVGSATSLFSNIFTGILAYSDLFRHIISSFPEDYVCGWLEISFTPSYFWWLFLNANTSMKIFCVSKHNPVKIWKKQKSICGIFLALSEKIETRSSKTNWKWVGDGPKCIFFFSGSYKQWKADLSWNWKHNRHYTKTMVWLTSGHQTVK